MKGFEFYVGTTDGQDLNRKYDVQGVMRFVAKSLVMAGIAGASMATEVGMWKGELETTVRVMVAIDEHQEKALKRVCEQCRDAFNQEAVMVVEKKDGYSFI